MEKYNEDILDDNFNNEESKGTVVAEDNSTSRFGKLLAIFSFAIGTLLFLTGMMDHSNDEVFLIGLFYTVIAFVVNLVVFLYLCIKSGTPGERKSYRRTAGLMALNIPIALIYLVIILGGI